MHICIYPTTTYRVTMPQPFSKVIGHVQAKWGSTWHFFKKLRRIYNIGNKQEKQSKIKSAQNPSDSTIVPMDSDYKMMHNDTFFVAYNLLVQKLWPHTFSCMSVQVTHRIFQLLNQHGGINFFFALPFGMLMGRVASQF